MVVRIIVDNPQVLDRPVIALVEMLERTQVLAAVPELMVAEIPPIVAVKVEVDCPIVLMAVQIIPP